MEGVGGRAGVTDKPRVPNIVRTTNAAQQRENLGGRGGGAGRYLFSLGVLLLGLLGGLLLVLLGLLGVLF